MFTNITMLASMPQSGPRAAGGHLVLFDGTCGLCTSLVGFVLPRDRVGVFRFASLASPAGRSVVAQLGGDPDDSSTMHVVAHYSTPRARHLTRASAALFVVATIGWPWKALALAGALPMTWLDRLYDAVARNRQRLFRRRERCLLPRPEWRGRFIDLRDQQVVPLGG
jgi:predicted DCC family thiol-disulfide oxidoreductase YuxK